MGSVFLIKVPDHVEFYAVVKGKRGIEINCEKALKQPRVGTVILRELVAPEGDKRTTQ